MECVKTSYFEHRLAELGITLDEAERHGLREDPAGNVLQVIRNFDGRPILWQDRTGTNKRKIERLKTRKTETEHSGLEQFNRELTIVRYSPDNLDAIRRHRPDAGKYKFPAKALTGHSVYPMPSAAAIDAYNAGRTGGVVVGIEGYFKAAALSVNGVEAVAFTGISTYRMCARMADYLIRRQPEDVVAMYDSDALDVRRDKATGEINTVRVSSFYQSAANFATQFFNFCQRHGLNIRLHFAMVHPDAGKKGVDDLIAAATPDERRRIIADFHTLADSRYFRFIRLHRTTYERKLTAFFGLTNHMEFYHRHAAAIGNDAFRFGGAKYRLRVPSRHFDLFQYSEGHQYFEALFDPFAVDMDVTELTVDKYMAEATGGIDNILATCEKVCISANTGTGKTAFFLGARRGGRILDKGYFKRTGTAGVVAVPTVMLAKQLAAKYKVPALHGWVSIDKREKALNSPVVVCTYDTLHHITDLGRRVLVVDEAHNLINQYGEIKTNAPFRAATLRRIAERFDVAAKTVLISATPSKMLAKEMGFRFVRVLRRENNMVNVYAIEAKKHGRKALTAATLAELAGLKWDDGRIHFVYYNNREQLEFIREHMVRSGRLSAEDVTVITREHVHAGHRIFNEVVTDERITGVKLVLSTCLMAEGLNITNTNIGNIYTVGINCVDSFRQFVARFRHMATVDVYDIRPPERRVDKRFLLPADIQVSALRKQAEAEAEALEMERAAMLSEFTEDELMFWDDIQPRYEYTGQIFRQTYTNDAGEVVVDELRIFAAVRERMVDYMNNVVFYTRLSEHANILIQGREALEADKAADIEREAKKTERAVREHKAATMERLRDDLREDPATVLHAYHLHAGRTNNRHATADVEALAGDLVDAAGELDAREYLHRHGEDFRHKWAKNCVRAFARLSFIGADPDAIRDELEQFREREFFQRWRKYTTLMELLIYEDRNQRKRLTARHRADIKAKKYIRKWVEDSAVDGVIRSDDLTKLLNDKFKRVRINDTLDGVNEQEVAIFTDGTAENMLRQLFDVDEQQFRRHKLFTIRPVTVPWGGGQCTPAQFVELLLNS